MLMNGTASRSFIDSNVYIHSWPINYIPCLGRQGVNQLCTENIWEKSVCNEYIQTFFPNYSMSNIV